MIIILTKKATEDELRKIQTEYGSFVKVVVDIEKEILAGGAAMHYDEERALLEYGCKQANLWGGGVDLESGEIDFDSMINIRPSQNNGSRTVLDLTIQAKMRAVIEKILK